MNRIEHIANEMQERIENLKTEINSKNYDHLDVYIGELNTLLSMLKFEIKEKEDDKWFM